MNSHRSHLGRSLAASIPKIEPVSTWCDARHAIRESAAIGCECTWRIPKKTGHGATGSASRHCTKLLDASVPRGTALIEQTVDKSAEGVLIL